MITFLVGTLSLLAWLFATSADGTAMRLLWKATIYFVFAPLLLVPFSFSASALGLDQSANWNLFAVIVLVPVAEEGLKVFAIRSERESAQIFALVAMFGIIELMLSKPLMMVGAPDGFTALINTFEAIPALFMHLLTAAIYGFTWRSRRDRQFITCLAIHGTWNALMTAMDQSSVSTWMILTAIPLFTVAIVGIAPRKMSVWQQSWHRAPGK